MPTYTVNNGITTPKGKGFEAGASAEASDFPQKDLKWLIEQGHITLNDGKAKKSAPKKVEKVEEVVAVEESADEGDDE